MAQLVEPSLLIPEVRGSTPDIRQNFIEHLFIINCIEKTIIINKEAGNGPLLKKIFIDKE